MINNIVKNIKKNLNNSEKKASIYFFLFFMIIGPIGVYFGSHSHEKTESELYRFYKEEFNESQIREIKKERYLNGRGNYTLFRVHDKQRYYPVLLSDSMKLDHYELFKQNVTLNKDSNSRKLRLKYKGEIHKIEIRKPEEEDDRMDTVWSLFLLLFLVNLINILIPYSLIDKLTSKYSGYF